MKFHFLYMFFISQVISHQHIRENGICYVIDDNNARHVEDCPITTSTIDDSKNHTIDDSKSTSTATSDKSLSSSSKKSFDILIANLLFGMLI